MKKLKENQVLKAEINKENIWAYLTGNIRHFLFYSKRFGSLLSTHIREQIEFRLRFMDKECFNNSECKMCGCHTPELQCATKSCDNPCYPEMMTKQKWDKFKIGKLMVVDKSGMWEYFPEVIRPDSARRLSHRGEDYDIPGNKEILYEEKLVRYSRGTKQAEIEKAFKKSEYKSMNDATKMANISKYGSEEIPLDNSGDFNDNLDISKIEKKDVG